MAWIFPSTVVPMTLSVPLYIKTLPFTVVPLRVQVPRTTMLPSIVTFPRFGGHG